MNCQTYTRVLEIARALKPRAQTGDRFHVSVLIRKRKIVCIGVNDYNKSHLAHRFGAYQSHKFSKDEYRPSLHSECSLAIRAGIENWNGYEMVNVRIDNNGRAAMSKCCPNCERVVKALQPNKIYYSIDDVSFGETK